MRTRWLRTPLLISAFAAVAGLTACLGTSPPPRYWVLSAPPGPAADVPRVRSLAVGPVVLPGYLIGPEICLLYTSDAADE